MTGGAGLGIDGGPTRKVTIPVPGPACAAGPCPGGGSSDKDRQDGKRPARPHSFIPRRRSEFPMTETEDRLIAAAAIIGDSSTPKTG